MHCTTAMPITLIGAHALSEQLSRCGVHVLPDTIITEWTDGQQSEAWAWAIAAPQTWLGRWLFGTPVKPDHLSSACPPSHQV